MWKEGREREAWVGRALGRGLKLQTGFGRATRVQVCLTDPRREAGDDGAHLMFWSCGQLGRYRPHGRWAGWTESTRWSPPHALAPPSRCYGDRESVLRLLGVASPERQINIEAGHCFSEKRLQINAFKKLFTFYLILCSTRLTCTNAIQKHCRLPACFVQLPCLSIPLTQEQNGTNITNAASREKQDEEESHLSSPRR